MNKRIWMGLLFIAILFLWNSQIYASFLEERSAEKMLDQENPSREGNFAVKIGLGYAFADLNLDFSEGTYKEGSQGSATINAGFRYYLLRFLSIGFDVDYNAVDLKKGKGMYQDANFGDLHIISNYALARLNVDFGSMTFYSEAGLGLNYFVLASRDFEDAVSLKNDVSFGVMAAGGFELFLSDPENLGKFARGIGIFTEVRWRYPIGAKIHIFGSEGDIKIHNISLLAGLNFYF